MHEGLAPPAGRQPKAPALDVASASYMCRVDVQGRSVATQLNET